MVRWFKIAGNQYLGFWALGLILFALQEIPYMLMPLFHPDPNPIMTMAETSALLDACEKVLGSLCIALMVSSSTGTRRCSPSRTGGRSGTFRLRWPCCF